MGWRGELTQLAAIGKHGPNVMGMFVVEVMMECCRGRSVGPCRRDFDVGSRSWVTFTRLTSHDPVWHQQAQDQHHNEWA